MTKKDATYIGPPVRVRETKNDGSVREFTTNRIEEGESLEILDGVAALNEDGTYLDEAVTKEADLPPVDNRSAAETPQLGGTERGVPTASAEPVRLDQDAEEERKRVAAKRAETDNK